MKRRACLGSLAPLVLVVTSGCAGAASAPLETPAAAARWDGRVRSTDITGGRAIFDERCEGCHPGGEQESGPRLRDLHWEAGRARRQVREGTGQMPSFGPNRIDDRQLEALLAYLESIGTVGTRGTATGTPSESRRAPRTGLARAMQKRARIAGIHRVFGLATWASTTVTVVLGGIQYVNLYGIGASQESNPCATGAAVFGQDQCSGTPWPHLASAGLTGSLYVTTLTLSLLMPSPPGLDEGDSGYARRLRRHRTLRWIHLGGMVAQILVGTLVANADQWLGLDRANDYGALQALATVHMGLGLITYGALTWAGSLML